MYKNAIHNLGIFSTFQQNTYVMYCMTPQRNSSEVFKTTSAFCFSFSTGRS